MRKAKIIATIGPASRDEKIIQTLIEKGINVARINMSHGTHEDHLTTMKTIRRVSEKVKKEIAILLDLQGPKIRVDKLKENLLLKEGESWIIGHGFSDKELKEFNQKVIPTTYESLSQDATVGGRVLFDDGLLEAVAVEKIGRHLKVEVKIGGELKSNKGINLPDSDVSAPSLTEKDEEDLYFGLKNNVDFIALSFVRTKECIKRVRLILHRLKMNVPIIAKIERPEAVKNIDEIIEVSDVIMIARGDMAVEIGSHLVPSVQKEIIAKCNVKGVPVVTATQMLESMIQNARPTRAEASDVANAVWDGSDAVMLSGETAAGKYPVEAVAMMDKIISEAEKKPKERPLIRNMDLYSVSASIQVAASMIAEKIGASWIISVTQSGNSCLKMSRFRPKKPVLGVTNSVSVMRRMCLYWGITPYFFDDQNKEIETLEYKMLDHIVAHKLVKRGEKVVINRGDGKFFSRGSSNTIRVETIVEDKSTVTTGDGEIAEATFKGGKILHDLDLCASCQNCVTICPHDIWEISPDEEKKTILNKKNAKQCELDMECVQLCPTGAIEIFPENL